MCQCVNKVILIGFLGEAPELKFSSQGEPIGTFSLAVNERWKDPEGARRERVEWFQIVCFGRLAEVYAVNGSSRVTMSTSKADCRLGNGKTVKVKSARQSKLWPTRCRFWIEPPRTEMAQRWLNHRNPQSLPTGATTPSTTREAKRRIKKSRFAGLSRGSASI